MMMRWVDNKQYICFDIEELFAWQDELDKYEFENQEKAWELFNDFLWEAECQLEYSEEFLRKLEDIEKEMKQGLKIKHYSFDDEVK